MTQSKKRGGTESLHSAVELARVQQVVEMLAEGASLQADCLGDTPLHTATSTPCMGSPDTAEQCVAALLDANAALDARKTNGNTALHLAADRGSLGCLRLLLTAGATLDVVAGFGSTPLHLAASRGHTACVKLLISAGAPVDSQTGEGSTPLHLAAVNGHSTVVFDLLKGGADPTLINREGKNAAEAAEYGKAVLPACGTSRVGLIRRPCIAAAIRSFIFPRWRIASHKTLPKPARAAVACLLRCAFRIHADGDAADQSSLPPLPRELWLLVLEQLDGKDLMLPF